MADDDDYYDNDYYYDDDTTTTTSTSVIPPSSSTTPESTSSTSPEEEISKSFATTKASITSSPEPPNNLPPHPFGESHPFGGPEGIPESNPEGEWHPGGEPETNPEGEWRPEGEPHGEPEGEWHPGGEPETNPEGEWRPEGEPHGEPEGYTAGVLRNLYQCKQYTNPWQPMGEPEGEPEPSINGTRPYAEPPAPLLQSVNYRERGAYSTLAGVIATLIILLNIFVLVALARKPKQRKSLTYLIGLVAVFDLLGGLQFLWFSSFDLHLMYTHADMWILVMCGIWMLSMAPQITAMIHFGLHMLNEMQLGVGNAKISVGKAAFICLTVFAVPVGLFIPPLAGWNCIGCVNRGENDQHCENKCSIPIFPFTKIYVLLMTILLLVAIVAAVAIFIAVFHKALSSDTEEKLATKSGKRNVVLCIFGLFLFAYMICVIPVGIVMIIDYVTVECYPELIDAFHATLFVTFLSNLVNPIVVFWKMPSMRNAFCRKSDRKNEASEENGHNGVNGAFAVDEKPPLGEEKGDGYEVANKV